MTPTFVLLLLAIAAGWVIVAGLFLLQERGRRRALEAKRSHPKTRAIDLDQTRLEALRRAAATDYGTRKRNSGNGGPTV